MRRRSLPVDSPLSLVARPRGSRLTYRVMLVEVPCTPRLKRTGPLTLEVAVVAGVMLVAPGVVGWVGVGVVDVGVVVVPGWVWVPPGVCPPCPPPEFRRLAGSVGPS